MITMSCGEERKKLACSQPEIRAAAMLTSAME